MTEEATVLLHDLVRYARAYGDPTRVKRRLGVRRAVFELLVDQAVEKNFLAYDDEQLMVLPAGIRLLQSLSAPHACPSCAGLGVLASEYLDPAERYASLRPAPNESIDQCPVTPQDLALRVALMCERGDVDGRRILCVGDNDLASLLMARVGHPTEVCVVDLDERVLDLIAQTAAREGLPIRTVRYDIRSITSGALPAGLEQQFDVFQTDPPYTEAGFKCYMALGLTALRRWGACYVVVPHMRLEDWTDELLFRIEGFLHSQGLVVTEVTPAFQTFVHEHEVVSSIVRAKRVGGIMGNPLAGLAELNLDKFYTIRG